MWIFYQWPIFESSLFEDFVYSNLPKDRAGWTQLDPTYILSAWDPGGPFFHAILWSDVKGFSIIQEKAL